jgi:hypothetical protein
VRYALQFWANTGKKRLVGNFAERLMLAYIFRRLLTKIPILIGISVVSFIIILLPTCSQDALFFDRTELLDIFMDHRIRLLGW